MYKILKFLLVLFIMILFIACGGGGSKEPIVINDDKSQDKKNTGETLNNDKEEVVKKPVTDSKFYKVSTLSKTIRVNGKEYDVVPYINNENTPNSEQNTMIYFTLMNKPFSIKLPDGLKGKQVYLLIKDTQGVIMAQTEKIEIIDNIKIANISLEEIDDLRPSFLEKHDLPVSPVF